MLGNIDKDGIKWKTRNKTLLEQFQNTIEKSQRQAKSIPVTPGFVPAEEFVDII